MDAGGSSGPADAPLTRSRTLLFISYRDSKAHRPRRRREYHGLSLGANGDTGRRASATGSSIVFNAGDDDDETDERAGLIGVRALT